LGFALSAFSPRTLAESQTNGFLVLEVERFTYAQGSPAGSAVKQSFKVPLTAEFISQFKNLPTQSSKGTGFYCDGGNLKSSDGSTRFTCSIWKTKDNRWAINIWGEGTETIQGIKVSTNPTASQWVVIKQWEDLDTVYTLSYVHNYDGMNITFKAKYEREPETQAPGAIPTVPVKKTDQSELFKGGDFSKLPLELKGGFQEG